MKKLTTLVLALVMVFSLAACGNKNSGTTSKEDTNKTENQKQLQLKALMRTMKKQIWKCLMMHKESL